MIMKSYQIILITLILILIASCGRKEYTEKGILEIKKEIRHPYRLEAVVTS